MAENEDKPKIDVRFIVEAQGKPPEYVNKELNQVRELIDGMRDVEVYDKKMEPPEEIKDGLYSCLMDLGLYFSNVETLFFATLRFGPSAVIVLGPEELKINFHELSNSLNDICSFLRTLSQDNTTLKIDKYRIMKKLKTLKK